MKLNESIAWHCRWFDVLSKEELGELEVLADCSEDDYQGTVAVAFLGRDGEVCYIEYSYGSCSECDAWEDKGEGFAREEILRTMARLPKEEFIAFAAGHWKLKAHLNEMVLRLCPQ